MFQSPLNIVFFLGGGGRWEKYLECAGLWREVNSKIKHTRCIFLNIFVQDCRLILNVLFTPKPNS